MENSKKAEDLLGKTLVIVKSLEQKAKMFSNGMLVLSLLDCIFGVLAIFCTSLTLTAFFASATSLTAITICGRVIQVSKIRQLEKSLKPLNLVAVAWFVNRYSKYFKKGDKKVKTEKLSKIQIASIIGAAVGVVFAIISAFVPQIAIAGNSVYNILIATGIEGVCAFAGTFKHYTKLTEEEIAKAKQLKEEKEKKAIVKEAKKEIENEKKLANQTQAQKEKEIARAELEAKLKAEKEKANAEYRAKVEQVKEQIKIEESQNIEHKEN